MLYLTIFRTSIKTSSISNVRVETMQQRFVLRFSNRPSFNAFNDHPSAGSFQFPLLLTVVIHPRNHHGLNSLLARAALDAFVEAGSDYTGLADCAGRDNGDADRNQSDTAEARLAGSSVKRAGRGTQGDECEER